MNKLLILLKYHLFSLWNMRVLYYGRLLEPIIYLIFFISGVAATISDNKTDQTNYLNYAILGILCIIAFKGGTFTISEVANNRKWGFLSFYKLYNENSGLYNLSIIIFSKLINLLQYFFIFILIHSLFNILLNSHIHISLLQFILLFIIDTQWILIGIIIGLFVKSYNMRSFLTTTISLPIIFTAPLFYKLDNVPLYFKIISMVNPLNYQVNFLRNINIHNCIFDVSINIGLTTILFIICNIVLNKIDIYSTER